MCAGICPQNCFTLNNKNYPTLNHSKCTQCKICEKICPGLEFNLNFFSKKLFGKPYSLKHPLGFFKNAYVGYATNQNLRTNATSGGVTTALLICLLENQKINGAIVTIPNKKRPEKFTPTIAKTKKQLLKSAQAKYTIIPLNTIFKTLKKQKGKYALVGLPCHIQAIRKLSQIQPKLANKISLIIGLYCGRTMEPNATLSLLKMLGIPYTEIKEIRYRGGPWPGEFQAITKNGNYYTCHKDIYMYLTRLYCPPRCLTCIDYTSEFSDLSVADAWTTKNGKWKYPGGQTIILERTKAGRKALQLAQEKGYIKIQKIPPQEAIKTHKNTSNLRKKGAIIRITNLKKKGKKHPNYGIPLPNVPWKDRKEEMRRTSGIIMGRFYITRKPIEVLALKLTKELHAPEFKQKPKIKRIFWYSLNTLMRKWFQW